ncbi:MAG: hypothetical protein ACXVP0_12785 [Bacteroidia bacterium]
MLLIVSTLVTCETIKSKPDTPEPLQDTIFLSQWRREKQEKLNLIASYESRLATLQKAHDSLQHQVNERKEQLKSDQYKTTRLENKLEAKITRADSGFVKADSLRPLIDSLTAACELDNATCNETIAALEQEVANRDSSAAVQSAIENNLRDIQRRQEVENRALTQQLDAACKEQRRTARQKKLLAGGLLILSGITSSFILTKSLK